MEIEPETVVTRACKEVVHFDEHRNRRKLTGYTYGSHDCMLRIYSKTEEIKKSGKQYMQAEWERNGWDKTSPVWRVENQLARRKLKEWNIETYSDLKRIAPDIWRYATGEWFTIRKPSVSNKQRSRWDLTETWEIVFNSFGNFGKLSGVVRELVKDASLDRLVPQIAGLFTSASAIIKSKKYQYKEMIQERKGIWLEEIMIKVEDYLIKKMVIVDDAINMKMRKYGLFEESYAYYPMEVR